MPCRGLRFVLSVVFYVVNENPQSRILSKSCKKKEKNTRNSKISGVVLELLGRFELPTSSLPTAVEPSSPCCTRLCGGFLSKKDEVAACLFHCFRPLIFPCGSRCGSNNFQDANEGRTSDSGNPSRCALSRS